MPAEAVIQAVAGVGPRRVAEKRLVAGEKAKELLRMGLSQATVEVAVLPSVVVEVRPSPEQEAVVALRQCRSRLLLFVPSSYAPAPSIGWRCLALGLRPVAYSISASSSL